MTAPGVSAPLLSFERATVGYGDRVVVRDAVFSALPGEFIGLVGPNGAGKSTLLRAATGGASVLGGDITSDGRSLVRMHERERARLVAVVPQAAVTPFAIGARAFVEMGRHPHLGRLATPGPADRVIVDDAMERTDTARLAAERIDELSGGDLQRLTLAQALAQEPRVLLLDEPTSHLDLNHALQVLDLVRALTDDGMAVVGVFHDLGLAARYADRIAIVADERVTVPAPPAEALDARVVARVFGVRAVVRTDPVTGALAVTPVVRGADLVRREGAPTVGVVCGSGTGAQILRRLALDGFAVHAGALNRGDVDEAVAEAVGADFLRLPPFGEIDAVAEAAVRGAFASAEAVVVAPVPFGRPNLPNLRAAVESRRPLVLVGDVRDGRDFTGGEAAALWDRALRDGAKRVETETDALTAVRAMSVREGR